MAIYRTSKQRFLDRFDPRDEGWIYRATDTSPGRWVTGPERDRLATQFGERTVLLAFAIVLDVPVAIGVLRMTAHSARAPAWVVLTSLVFLLIALPVSAAFWRAAAPWVLLHGQANVDDGPTGNDRKRRRNVKETWSGLVLDFLYSALLLSAFLSHPWAHVWRRAEFYLAALFICCALSTLVFRILRLVRRARA